MPIKLQNLTEKLIMYLGLKGNSNFKMLHNTNYDLLQMGELNFSTSEGSGFSESRVMGKARMKNLNIQRKLHLTISSIEQEWETKISRISIEQRYINQMLQDMKKEQRGGHRRLILPLGLSLKQINLLKKKREEEYIRSISLREFDKKMHLIMDQRRYYRNTIDEYRKERRRKGKEVYLPNEAKEMCVSTNVHLNLYQNVERDQTLHHQMAKMRFTMRPESSEVLKGMTFTEKEVEMNASDPTVKPEPKVETDNEIPHRNPLKLTRHHTNYTSKRLPQIKVERTDEHEIHVIDEENDGNEEHPSLQFPNLKGKKNKDPGHEYATHHIPAKSKGLLLTPMVTARIKQSSHELQKGNTMA